MKVKKLNENFELIENTSVFKCSSGDLNENMLEEDNFVYYRDIDSHPVSHLFWNDSKEAWVTDPSEATIFSNNEEIENRAERIIQTAMKKFQKSRNELLNNYILQGHKSILTKLHSKKQETTQAEKDYREFANIDEAFEITAENIDAWALNEAAVKNNIQTYDLKHVLLKEGTTIDQAGRELEAEIARAESQNQVDKVLDRSLKIAKRKQRSGDTGDFPNILLVSDAGFGKTDMVRQWAKKNGINLVQKNLGTMGIEAFGGINARDAEDPRYSTRLGTNEMIKALSKPNSVLFLDEYNRSKTEVRGAVLTLVQNHMVWDPTAEGDERFLENFLFTVAAINPPNAAYKGAKEMDPAEMSRFYTIHMQPDPMEHLKYLRSFYTAKIESAGDEEEKLEYRRKLALAEKILTSVRPLFTYDSAVDIEENQDNPSYKPLNYRSFKMALDYSDGTKDDFLDVWNHYCNPKKKHTIEEILGDYVDIDDKANAALKDDSASNVFSKEMSARAKLKNAFSELNI